MKEYKIYLSSTQVQKLKNCEKLKKSCTIRINLNEKSNTKINLTNEQLDIINRAKKEGKEYCQLTFSSTHIGGFLPFLIPLLSAAAIGAAGAGGQALVKKITGTGVIKDIVRSEMQKIFQGEGIKLIGKSG